MGHPVKQSHVTSSIPSVPITTERPVPEDLDSVLPNPGQPRANYTEDREHPREGTVTNAPDKSVLHQHMEFWDRDGDGTVWPTDTFRGFKDLGFPWIICFLAVPIIHGTFSYWTLDSWIPHLGFPIRLKRAHKTKHGSDSETFDTEGRFVPEKFEEVFSKYDQGQKGGLSLKDINSVVKGNANVMDFVGQFAEWLEWNVSYYLAAVDIPEHGKLLLKEDARGIIDGSLFAKIAREIKQGRLKRTSIFRAGLSPRVPAAGGAEHAVRKEQ
jgi:peroxygenase